MDADIRGLTKNLPNTTEEITVYFFNEIREGMRLVQGGNAGVMVEEHGVINIYVDKKDNYRGHLQQYPKLTKVIKTKDINLFVTWLKTALEVCKGIRLLKEWEVNLTVNNYDVKCPHCEKELCIDHDAHHISGWGRGEEIYSHRCKFCKESFLYVTTHFHYLIHYNNRKLDELVESARSNLALKLKTSKIIKPFDLSYETLTNINLENQNFEGAYLVGVKIENSNLKNIDLGWSNLSIANLSKINLEGANLCWSNLNNVILNEINLSNAYLCNANLNNAILNKVNLNNADLRNANLNGTKFHNVTTKNCNFDNTIWDV